METFYDNYCDPAAVDRAAASNGGRRRNYPVVCVNYHKMWDNKEALVRALGLPAGEALKVRCGRRDGVGRVREVEWCLGGDGEVYQG